MVEIQKYSTYIKERRKEEERKEEERETKYRGKLGENQTTTYHQNRRHLDCL